MTSTFICFQNSINSIIKDLNLELVNAEKIQTHGGLCDIMLKKLNKKTWQKTKKNF